MKSNPSQSKALPIFLSTTIDTPLIQTIHDYDTFINAFHHGWRRDSRPRMLFIKPLTLPPLRYCIAAFRAADHLAAGYINSDETSHNDELVRKFNVNPNEETLLIYHEDSSQPVYRQSATKLSSTLLDNAMLSYSQLTIPRIYSRARLLDLCPTDGTKPASKYAYESDHKRYTQQSTMFSNDQSNHRHLCLVLLLNSKLANVEQLYSFGDIWLTMLRHTLQLSQKDLLQLYHTTKQLYNYHFIPVHIYVDRQVNFMQALSKSSNCLNESCNLLNEDNIGRLALIWRISSTETIYQLLPTNSLSHPKAHYNAMKHHSALKSENFQNNLLKSAKQMHTALINDLKNIIQTLNTTTTTNQFDNPIISEELINSEEKFTLYQWYLLKNCIIEELIIDELVATIWIRIRNRLLQIGLDIGHIIFDLVNHPLAFVFSSFMIIIGLLLYSLISTILQAMRNEQRNKCTSEKYFNESTQDVTSNNNSTSSSQYRSTQRSSTVTPVISLNPSTYDRLVRDAPKGFRLLILCVRGTAQDNRLRDQFEFKTRQVCGNQIQRACLSMNRYSGWLAKLLESIRLNASIQIRSNKTRQNNSKNTNNHNTKHGTLFINPMNCIGTVIAVNGYRRYFNLYHPLIPGSQSSSDENSEESDMADTCAKQDTVVVCRTRKRHIFGRVFGMESDDEEAEAVNDQCNNHSHTLKSRHQITDGVLFDSELLNGLANWLDRLFEGSLPRYTVTEWPISLLGNDIVNDEDDDADADAGDDDDYA
ncbi:unnamed protein product [Schistosoma turkestanicum]|nr:unnamed protein product [Schistosoma turkestanicum]